MLREALTSPRLYAMTPDEASAYFVAYGTDELNDGEQSLLSEWLAADRDHVLAFDRAKRAWHSLDGADGHEILDAMRAHALRRRPDRWRHWSRILAVAAMLVLVATTSLLFLSPYHRAPTGQAGPVASEAPWTQYASADNAVRAVSLADGSVMTLDAGSLALVRFLPGERSIRLERGRVFFDVAKDAAHPFAVAAAGRRIVALGTRFEVDMSDAALRVSLFRGKVAIKPLQGDGQSVFLDPGQQFLEKDGTIAVTPTGATSKGNPAWLNGMIDLDATPLGEAVKQVNRYSRDQIRISDPAIAAIHVTGQFRASDADRFARTITEVYPVRMVRRDNGIDLVSGK